MGLLSFNRIFTFGLVAAGLVFLAGCAGVISDPAVRQVNRQASLAAVMEAPDRFTGQMVLWSGKIVSTEPLDEGTLIEVVHIPGDFNRRPRQSDATEGRFLALNTGFLDPAVYAEGREITVAGQIKEMRTQALGKIQYTYPLVAVTEIHLWPAKQAEVVRDHGWFYGRPYYYHGFYHGYCRW